MRCSRCGFENREGIRFCEECGGKLEAQSALAPRNGRQRRWLGLSDSPGVPPRQHFGYNPVGEVCRMRVFRILALNASLLIFDQGGHVSLAQAQPVFTSPAHEPVSTEAAIGALISLARAILLIALITAGVWLRNGRRRRWEEARDLEGQLAAAFLRDHRFAGVLLTARASVPIMPGRPVKIVIVGSIPSKAVRSMVLQMARDELKSFEGETIIEDRLTVSPAVPPVAA